MRDFSECVIVIVIVIQCAFEEQHANCGRPQKSSRIFRRGHLALVGPIFHECCVSVCGVSVSLEKCCRPAEPCQSSAKLLGRSVHGIIHCCAIDREVCPASSSARQRTTRRGFVQKAHKAPWKHHAQGVLSKWDKLCRCTPAHQQFPKQDRSKGGAAIACFMNEEAQASWPSSVCVMR